jgi:predicted DNA-binding antitoxin AbrB/MazE fold protein
MRTKTLSVAAKMATQANVMTIPAKYEKGIFRPLENVAIKEGTVVEVHVPAEGESALGRRSIKDLPFYGMWADRDDIADGVSYVNALRNNPRG